MCSFKSTPKHQCQKSLTIGVKQIKDPAGCTSNILLQPAASSTTEHWQKITNVIAGQI
jgi:hypothetical protein